MANQAPTAIALDNDTIDENSLNGVVIGNLSSTDADLGEMFTYSLVDDAGGRFAINGQQLMVADGSLLDFEKNTSHVIEVQTTDSGGLSFTQILTIAVTDDITDAFPLNFDNLGLVINEGTNYIVTDTPYHGNLLLNGAELEIGSSFTQTNINDGQLIYHYPVLGEIYQFEDNFHWDDFFFVDDFNFVANTDGNREYAVYPVHFTNRNQGLTINGNAKIDDINKSTIRLTDDSIQAGSFFLTEAISINNNSSFSSYFQFQINNVQVPLKKLSLIRNF